MDYFGRAKCIDDLCENGKLELWPMEERGFYRDKMGDTWMDGEPYGDEDEMDRCGMCNDAIREVAVCFSMDRGGDSVCEECVQINDIPADYQVEAGEEHKKGM